MRRPYIEDPEPGDDTDPEYREQLFLLWNEQGVPPEHLIDPEFRAAYEQWLKEHGV